ncbi:MAG: hypothetical protein LBF59_08180 [Prevotellaceae bacterium]|nr:hypothetical protein [Prevotellaceae bacterium]
MSRKKIVKELVAESIERPLFLQKIVKVRFFKAINPIENPEISMSQIISGEKKQMQGGRRNGFFRRNYLYTIIADNEALRMLIKKTLDICLKKQNSIVPLRRRLAMVR